MGGCRDAPTGGSWDAYPACSHDAQHGTQMYVMEDTDGFVFVRMDPVSVADYTDVRMHGWVYTAATIWSDWDLTRVWAVDESHGPSLPPSLPPSEIYGGEMLDVVCSLLRTGLNIHPG